MDPGLRLRQIRERLGLTYRDVQEASFALAQTYTRPQFTVHISRLADIENAGAVPSLHKLYALAVVYHLNPLEILTWYDKAAALRGAPRYKFRALWREGRRAFSDATPSAFPVHARIV